MKKTLLNRFIKDRLLLISFYLLNVASLITFFHLIEPSVTEVLYPLLFSLFILSLYLLIDWFKYYSFNRALYQAKMNMNSKMNTHTYEQALMVELLAKQKEESIRQYHCLKEQNDSNLYFLSHFMHYLKAPLSVITLLVSNDKKKDPTWERIDVETGRMLAAIDQALTMTRMESFENDMDVRATDLVQLIRDIINERKREFIHHGIYPVIDCPFEEVVIATDRKWCRSLLSQVVSNAMKYSSLKEGGKQLSFIIEQQEKSFRLSIRDEGIGIPSYDLDYVFNAFFTGENGRKTASSSGIGLYMCKRIADRLGHSISIASEVEKGTTVILVFQKANRY
ncbi:MAG: sensor histidine kinase [Lysinibacillus sp.]